MERCQQLAGTVSNHDMSFTQAADFLFYLHDTLQQARAPVYDIPTAAELLVTGSYKRLPKCIEDLGMHPVLTGEEKEGDSGLLRYFADTEGNVGSIYMMVK